MYICLPENQGRHLLNKRQTNGENKEGKNQLTSLRFSMADIIITTKPSQIMTSQHPLKITYLGQ